MEIEVFLCVADYHRIAPELSRTRYAFANACHAAWEQMGYRVNLLRGEGLGFRRERRIQAEAKAQGKVYIVADDDCLPDPRSVISDDSLWRLSHFAVLSFWPVNAKLNPWTPKGYAPYEDREVMEHVSVGGIRVCRKGAMKYWPPCPDDKGYDGIEAEVLRADNWKVGYLKTAQMLHLGEGFSTVWPTSKS